MRASPPPLPLWNPKRVSDLPSLPAAGATTADECNVFLYTDRSGFGCRRARERSSTVVSCDDTAARGACVSKVRDGQRCMNVLACTALLSLFFVVVRCRFVVVRRSSSVLSPRSSSFVLCCSSPAVCRRRCCCCCKAIRAISKLLLCTRSLPSSGHTGTPDVKLDDFDVVVV